MDDIDALHAHLAKFPDNHTARLVLADRLEDAGSPLAEGYRALGAWERSAGPVKKNDKGAYMRLYSWYWLTPEIERRSAAYFLPKDWYAQLAGGVPFGLNWRDFPIRRAAEDAAALAFTKLPDDRKRALLAALYGAPAAV